jgi:hypothetical protein
VIAGGICALGPTKGPLLVKILREGAGGQDVATTLVLGFGSGALRRWSIRGATCADDGRLGA